MNGPTHPDSLVLDDNWSDLSRLKERPAVDDARMHRYRMGRLLGEMRALDVALCVMVSPISLRYALDYRNYALFMSHIPSTCLLLTEEGEYRLDSAFDQEIPASRKAPGQPISFMYGGRELDHYARLFADDIVDYMAEQGISGRRIAVEYINPSIVQALEKRGVEVIDGVRITEQARLIKSEDEINCIRWAVAVAEHGADRLHQALRPGVSELQLWGLLNYANLANNGDWHDGRMLASGPRINPWLQEASPRKVEAGDLVGFDTDMIGPRGYFADLSRTFFCGPGRPSRRQKEVYRLAMAEIEHNLTLVRPGMAFSEFQARAYPVPEEFQANAYPCILHGVGMCDEYPHLNPSFRGPVPYEDTIQPGMVLCIESYMGASGESVGVKLEQQVLVTEDGYELLTRFPFEDALL